MIAITGANGQLGRLVIQSLQRIAPGERIIAAVRSPAKAQDLKSRDGRNPRGRLRSP